MIKSIATIGPIFSGGTLYDAHIVDSKGLLAEDKQSNWLFATMIPKNERLLRYLQIHEPKARFIPREVGLQLSEFGVESKSRKYFQHSALVTLLGESCACFWYYCSCGTFHFGESEGEDFYPYIAFLKPRSESVSALKLPRFQAG
jgi:hypothetical protein